jgi:hypothetical protein
MIHGSVTLENLSIQRLSGDYGNMASLEAYNGAGKIHTMGRNLPVKFKELPVNIMIPY